MVANGGEASAHLIALSGEWAVAMLTKFVRRDTYAPLSAFQ